jgi:hypothetical protein
MNSIILILRTLFLLMPFCRSWKFSVFTGSHNATEAAFERNVEFMVELRGMRSAHGVRGKRIFS